MNSSAQRDDTSLFDAPRTQRSDHINTDGGFALTQPPINSAFESLTLSAFDFLDQAASGLKKTPKYAVINLAKAIELFLKARLVKEHWSLVVLKPEKATQASFAAGAFQSVGLTDSIERLRNIAGVGLSRNEETSFRDLRDHRNKLVHFYHKDYLGNPSEPVLSDIAAEQCRAWFLLRRLLEVNWSPTFDAYKKDFARVPRLIEKNREFLDGKYRALKPEIDASITRGAVYEKCGSCGHPSAHVETWIRPINDSACAVCGRSTKYATVPCPNCSAPIRVEDVGEGHLHPVWSSYNSQLVSRGAGTL